MTVHVRDAGSLQQIVDTLDLREFTGLRRRDRVLSFLAPFLVLGIGFVSATVGAASALWESPRSGYPLHDPCHTWLGSMMGLALAPLCLATALTILHVVCFALFAVWRGPQLLDEPLFRTERHARRRGQC